MKTKKMFYLLVLSLILMSPIFLGATNTAQAGIYSCDTCDYEVEIEVRYLFADDDISEPWYDDTAEIRLDIGYSDPNGVTPYSTVNEYVTLQTYYVDKDQTKWIGTTVTLEGGVDNGMVLYFNMYEIDVGFDDFVVSGEVWVDNGADYYIASNDASGFGAEVGYTVGV